MAPYQILRKSLKLYSEILTHIRELRKIKDFKKNFKNFVLQMNLYIILKCDLEWAHEMFYWNYCYKFDWFSAHEEDFGTK